MRFFAAAIFISTIISTTPVLAQTGTPTGVLQDRTIGASMNSLFYHSDDFQDVPTWLDRMADADGGKSVKAQGGYDSTSNNPPNWKQNWKPDVKSPGASASWRAINAVNFTDVIIVPDNFSGPPAFENNGTNPRVAGPVPRPGGGDWVTEIAGIITPFEANTDDTPNYWVYEGWADAGRLLGEFTGEGSSRDFAKWRERTTTQFGYGEWFDNLVGALREDFPSVASRIKLIPVARVMVSVMENTAASALAAEDWFEDNAPHGQETCYLLVAMIVYSTLYQEQAPMPDFTGADINETFMKNYDSIAAHIHQAI